MHKSWNNTCPVSICYFAWSLDFWRAEKITECLLNLRYTEWIKIYVTRVYSDIISNVVRYTNKQVIIYIYNVRRFDSLEPRLYKTEVVFGLCRYRKNWSTSCISISNANLCFFIPSRPGPRSSEEKKLFYDIFFMTQLWR